MKKPRKSTPSLHWWLEKTTWKNGWFKSHHLDLLRPALSNKILWELHNILNLQGKLSSMRCIGFDEHMSFKPAAKNMKKDLQSLKHPSVTFHPHSHSISSSTKFGCNWIAIPIFSIPSLLWLAGWSLASFVLELRVIGRKQITPLALQTPFIPGVYCLVMIPTT